MIAEALYLAFAGLGLFRAAPRSMTGAASVSGSGDRRIHEIIEPRSNALEEARLLSLPPPYH